MLDLPTFISISTPCRGVAQPGSASALGAEGRRFESVHPDQNILQNSRKTRLLQKKVRESLGF